MKQAHEFYQDPIPREVGRCDFTFADGDWCGRPEGDHVDVAVLAADEPSAPKFMDVVDTIMSGAYDMQLAYLRKAIGNREEQIAQNRAMSLAVGDRVRIQGVGAGAKYLNGMEATVIGFAIKNIKIRIDAQYDTRRYSHTMRMPPSLLRLIPRAVSGELEATSHTR